MISRFCIFGECSFLAFAVAFFGYVGVQGQANPKKEATKTMIEWGPKKNGVRNAVVLPSEKRVFAGEPLYVELLTGNVGDDPATIIAEGQLLSVFNISVIGPDRKPTPYTSYGIQQKQILGVGSRGTRALAPGKEDKVKVLLNRIFDMTRHGEYKVSFTRWARVGNDSVSVTSNVLTIEVKGEKTEYEPSK